MSYSNEYLRDFAPVFSAILKAKGIKPEKAELEVIDEEEESQSIFEPADVRDVLEQLSSDLNFLTVYTERPEYFREFAETMYEENGLIVTFFPKKIFRAGKPGVGTKLVLDFEWEGKGYETRMKPGIYYIPIHKKPWRIAENLDIIVPIGYNTVIVKGIQKEKNEPGWDKFESAFYEGK